MNLNQTFISAPGTVMHYNCLYMYSMSLFAHNFDIKNGNVNGEWVVHVGGLT